jgi:hypothetical protein
VSTFQNLNGTHEEADTILVQQAILAADDVDKQVVVISDDTDVFLLLLYFYNLKKISATILMESPVQGRTRIDIGASTIQHEKIIPDVLAAHAMTGCDTTAMCYGIGKNKAIKVLKRGHSLSLVGDLHADLCDMKLQASKFMAACYGASKCNTTSEARVKLWADKVGSATSQLPKLCSLPSTNSAFEENLKRAHLQTCIWKHSMESDPPDLDPLLHGFYKDENSRCLLPTTMPENIPVAPPEILKLVKCSCESVLPCNSNRCSCRSASLPCTMFCSCTNSSCSNDLTRFAEVEVERDEDSVDEPIAD